jgi:ribonucleoside-diphosphate reductase alpha chain
MMLTEVESRIESKLESVIEKPQKGHIELNNEIMIRKDGFFQLEKDKEAIEMFKLEIESKMLPFPSFEEKIEYLIKEQYYYDMLAQYSMKEIKQVYNLVKRYGFKFESYMAISKLYKDYAMKTRDKKKYLEHYEDRVASVALYAGKGNVKKAEEFAIAMIEQRYQPATPTFLNAAKARRGELVSCFLLEIADSLNAINYAISTSMQLSKIGGGVSLLLSRLRSRGESIKGEEGVAKGCIPVMKLLEDAFSYADQQGQRPGAGAVYLDIFHWDIEEFLGSKKINVDEKSRIKTLSIGVVVPSKFFELARNNKPYYVFAPHSVFVAYGKDMVDMDMDEMYDEFVANPAVNKKLLDARDMLTQICSTQIESGYPYIFYKTNANNNHALKALGTVQFSNLCTEISQISQLSIITNYGEPDVISLDISCILGSINIVNTMELKKVRETIHTGMDMLTMVTDSTDIENAPGVKRANKEMHSVGLGAMNLNGFYVKNRIMYESEEAKDFANTFFMMMNFYSLERSMQIAKERNETFVGFEQSEYAKGTYFNKYLTIDYAPVTDKVKSLFDGIYIPTMEDWTELKKSVMKYGVYHAYRMAPAPTASISYIQNSTPSIMPIVDMVEDRTYGNSKTYYPMPFLTVENQWYYKSAYNMNQYKIMDLIAVMQNHVDQAISCILFVKRNVSTKELQRFYLYADRIGLKSLYYTRQKNEKKTDECLSCSV